ncbi:acyltransferase family protein [Burkholderia sp. AU32262]|uniref:acyltransferase family protein n=1 Tax=Burkholderia sp. AU32262 TaxID=2879630 RepID=UPI001CF4A3A6|nr:acyltransferase [Burkholderia sp. AU32262]MCA8239840.1 acyltransferase [Burkholderia sp. AU32262]
MRLKHLDGLRGVLALAVAASHTFGFFTGWAADRPLVGARMAVMLFFVLSGSVLSGYLERTQERPARFVVTRFLRLWPLHAGCLVGACAGFALLRAHGEYAPAIDMADPITLLFNFAFLARLGIRNVELINDPSWTIGIEFWVSALVLPALYRAPRGVVVAVIVAGAAALATAGHVFYGAYLAPHVSAGLISAIEAMAIGTLIYRSTRADGAFTEAGSGILRTPVYYAGAALVLVSLYVAPTYLRELVGLVGFLPFLFVRAFEKNGDALRAVLNSRVAQWLGAISFPLYLSHMPVQIVMLPAMRALTTSHAASIVILIGGSLVAAWLLQVGFERPVEALAKKRRAAWTDQTARA